MITCRAIKSDGYGYNFLFNDNKSDRSTFKLMDGRNEDENKGIGLAFDYSNQEIYILGYDMTECDYYDNQDIDCDGDRICYMENSYFYTWKQLWDKYRAWEDQRKHDKELFILNGFERVAILEKEVADLKETVRHLVSNYI